MTQLLQNALYGTALILAAAALRRALKDRLIPEARLCLWAVCLFRLLTPAAPESVFSLWGLFQAPPPQPAQTPRLYIPAQPLPAPAPQPSAPGLSWEMALGLAWLAVGLALAVRYVWSWRRTRRAVAGAIPLERDDPRYVPLPPCARLREGPMEGAPLTFGAVRPTVVLSPGLEGDELECVLAHEGVHAARRDNLWYYAMALALAVYWWDPAVWLMSRLLRRDIELACDRAALKKLGTDKRARYANALVTLATQGRDPAFCQTFGRKAVEERILSIMKFKKTSIVGAIFSLTLVLALTAAFASEPKEPQPEYGNEKTGSSQTVMVPLPDSQDRIVWIPDIEKTKDIVVNDLVDPDNVDLSMIEEKYAQKVADGEMTQEEADEAMDAFRDMLDQARRGEVKLFRTDDGWINGMGASKMYVKDEHGELVPVGTDTAANGYVLEDPGQIGVLERPCEDPFFLSYPGTSKDTFRAEYKAVLERSVAKGKRDRADLDSLMAKLDELMAKIDEGKIHDLRFSTTANGELCYALDFDTSEANFDGDVRLPTFHEDEVKSIADGVAALLGKGDTTYVETVNGYDVHLPFSVDELNALERGTVGQKFFDYAMVVDGSAAVSGSVIRTSGGAYELCKDKDCKVSYDHCHIDGKTVRVYHDNPGLLCAHPDCGNEKPHEHDGVNYAGKAPEAYVILDPDMAPAPSADPVKTGYDHRPDPVLMSLDEYAALLDGLVSQGKMTREDADWFLDGATKGMKSERNRLFVTEDGSYAIM
ncbi:MAG: M56 family metallopeptidase [Oscillospiraceae bacterium]|nr:M56 family metallopeptidase [Oscillospiraceae bacterium]